MKNKIRGFFRSGLIIPGDLPFGEKYDDFSKVI
jgi:hypothetical protein